VVFRRVCALAATQRSLYLVATFSWQTCMGWHWSLHGPNDMKRKHILTSFTTQLHVASVPLTGIRCSLKHENWNGCWNGNRNRKRTNSACLFKGMLKRPSTIIRIQISIPITTFHGSKSLHETRFHRFLRGEYVFLNWNCQIREFHAEWMEWGEALER